MDCYEYLNEICPYCKEKTVFRCKYPNREEDVSIECETCYTVIREEAR